MAGECFSREMVPPVFLKFFISIGFIQNLTKTMPMPWPAPCGSFRGLLFPGSPFRGKKKKDNLPACTKFQISIGGDNIF